VDLADENHHRRGFRRILKLSAGDAAGSEGFPDLAHDGEVDASSEALKMLNRQMKNWGLARPPAREW
jgi:hypothetical protein